MWDMTPVDPAPATTAEEALSPNVPEAGSSFPPPRASMRPGPAAAAEEESSAETVEREGDGNEEPDQTPASDSPDDAEDDAPTGAI